MKRLRLLKVLIQPVLVVDDGEGLSEANTQPVEVAADDWPSYPDVLAARIVELEDELNAEA